MTALLKTNNLSFSKHSGVLSAYRQHYIKTGIFSTDMGKIFRDVFDMRQAGDYEMLTRFDPEDLKKQIDNMNLFVGEVEKWLLSHNYLSDRSN